MSAGQVTVGAWLSLTVTVKVQSAELFPLASVAWQVTVVVPLGNVASRRRHTVALRAWSSDVCSSDLLCGADSQLPAAVVVVMLAGQVTVGAWLSLKIGRASCRERVLMLAAVAWQVKVVVPLGKVEPLGGVQVVVEPGQLSVAVVV